MKDGAIVCNSGHFDVEIDIKALQPAGAARPEGRAPNRRRLPAAQRPLVYVIGEGRLVNLAAAEGHPASVMDMSFATQALSAEWALKMADNGKLAVKVHDVPKEIEDDVAALKLDSMGIKIDRLTAEQKQYLTLVGGRDLRRGD